MPEEPAVHEAREAPAAGPRWNAGGWFGGQLGGTVWLLLLGILLLGIDVVSAVGVLLCFAGANAVGSWLWSRRRQLRLHPSLMGMMAACGVAALLALLLLDARGTSGLLGPSMSYWVLLIFPGVMLMVHLQHRSRPTRKAGRDEPSGEEPEDGAGRDEPSGEEPEDDKPEDDKPEDGRAG